jgi:hypothetical protein
VARPQTAARLKEIAEKKQARAKGEAKMPYSEEAKYVHYRQLPPGDFRDFSPARAIDDIRTARDNMAVADFILGHRFAGIQQDRQFFVFHIDQFKGFLLCRPLTLIAGLRPRLRDLPGEFPAQRRFRKRAGVEEHLAPKIHRRFVRP